MAQRIQAPNGDIVEFPDGMSDDAISAVMRKEYGGPEASAPAQGNPNGPQPSLIDRAVASPVGRFVQDNIINTVMGAARQIENLPSHIPFPGLGIPLPNIAQGKGTVMPFARDSGAISKAMQAENAANQAAIDRNKNTPGYAAARAYADQNIAARGGSGFMDQLTAPFNPTLGGLAGIPGGFDAMNANADAQTEAQRKYQEQHPYLSFTGNIMGGLLASPAGVTRSMAKPMPKAAITPEAQALSRVQGIMAQSPNVPDVIALRGAMSKTGKPLTSAEMIGKPAEVMLGALARREGATADAFGGMMAGRNEAAPGRILDDFSAASGIVPEAALGDMQSLVQKGRKAASPLYDAAYARPAATSDRLNQFAQNKVIQSAIAKGVKLEELDALKEGAQFNPGAYSVTGFNEAGDPIIGGVPTWRSWDAAKRGLDTIIAENTDTITGKMSDYGKSVDGVRRALLKELDSLNPDFAAARSVSSDYLSAQDAFNRGTKAILNDNMPAQQFTDMFNGMKGANQEAFKGGIANKLFNLSQSNKLNTNRFITPIVQAKLEVALGRENAARFIANLKAEKGMVDFARKRAPGAGSPTAEYADAFNEMDNGGNAAIDFAERVARNRGNVRGAVTDMAANKVADLVARRRTSGLPLDVRDVMGQLLMDPQKLAKALDASPNLRGVGGGILSRPSMPSVLPYGLLGILPSTSQPRN